MNEKNIEIKKLIDELNKASELYYNGGDTVMSDREFNLGNGRNQFEIGISCAVFPPTDRLVGYTQAIGKCFLR